MKTKIQISVRLTALTLGFSAIVMATQAFGANGWLIDEDLKVHLVYLPSRSGQGSSSEPHLVPALKNTETYMPDITNIGYKTILGLGFPLPNRPDSEKLRLYLKLDAWPRQLDQRESSSRIFNQFSLGELAGGRTLFNYVGNPSHVLIKYAAIDNATRVFTSDQPFPSSAPSSQEVFDSSLPFSSIYVLPGSQKKETKSRPEADRAILSAQGVVAFHRELSDLYQRIFRPLGEDKERKHDFYAQIKRCVNDIEKLCGLTVYELPKAPLIFTNFTDLPMPQDPKNVFVSGLLLVKLTEYAAKTPIEETHFTGTGPGDEKFTYDFYPIWSHVLEVGSVYDRRRGK